MSIQFADGIIIVWLAFLGKVCTSSRPTSPSIQPFLFALIFEDILHSGHGAGIVLLGSGSASFCKFICNFIPRYITVPRYPLESYLHVVVCG